MTIKRVTSEQARKLQGTTDWCRADAMEDKKIDEAAKSDPDSALPTPDELKQFHRVAGKKAKKEKS